MVKHTTLSVSTELADEIRSQPGSNTDERLKNWADSRNKENTEQYMTEQDVRRLIEEYANGY